MNNINDFVKPVIIDQEKQRILLSKQYLGTPEAEVWIGPDEEGPKDDEDELVIKRRNDALRAWQEGRTTRPSGISAFNIDDSDGDDYYEMDVSLWPSGYYRFNYHGRANEKTPNGTLLEPEKRDLQYSWAVIPVELLKHPEVEPFIYWEPNGRGWCIRIHIDQSRRITPAGESKK